MRSFEPEQARRIALVAQGFAEPRPAGRIDARHLRRVIGRLGLLQIDSVNVLVRAHYMPLFSRLGPYPRALLDRLAYDDRELFEYWGHEASLMPVELFPLLRWRMSEEGLHPNWRRWAGKHADVVARVRAGVEERGEVAAGELSDGSERSGAWWGWGSTKTALEYLFKIGVVTARRRGNFERVYEPIERALPHALTHDEPAPQDAMRALLLRSARALGIATASDLCDYYRLHKPTARPIVKRMAEEGELEEVGVAGWRDPAFVLPGTTAPRRPVLARALLSPFDPLVFERARTERLFGFRYRIEIYVPAPKRVYGYYVLPFLLGERLVARADLKADRKARTLVVQAAFREDGVEPEEAAGGLAAELRAMAAWLELDRVSVVRRGNLAAPLRKALASED